MAARCPREQMRQVSTLPDAVPEGRSGSSTWLVVERCSASGCVDGASPRISSIQEPCTTISSICHAAQLEYRTTWEPLNIFKSVRLSVEPRASRAVYQSYGRTLKPVVRQKDETVHA